jgi:hypothetical protein
MRTLLFACVLAVSLVARAGAGEQAPTDLAAAVAQQHEIRAALEAHDPQFDYLGKNRRLNVISAQDRLFAMTDGKARIEDLPPNDQVRAFNQLKRIEALLIRKDVDQREVCERTALAGTKRQQLACYDKAEQDKRADQARDALMARPACTQPGCI